MCGIAGYLGSSNKESIIKMLSAITYRGPDDSDIFQNNDITLGHKRLSIIDLTTRGRQPMRSKDGRFLLVYNGEIYNHSLLRDKLNESGEQFQSDTDSEVILRLFEQEGVDCFNKLNGMFAFAIWDQQKGELTLCRDRLGIKPLYYYLDGDNFVFASEIKAIIQHQNVKKNLNKESLVQTLALRYSPHPNTVVKNVFKLSPAHFLKISLGKKPTISRYWSPPPPTSDINFNDAKENLLSLLEESVGMQLMSDVPIAALLSGGVDSGAICTLAAKKVKKLKTFSIGFSGAKDNEFERARVLANTINSDHTEILVQNSDVKLFPHVIWHNDEPVAGPSSLAYLLALRKIKKEATVLLLGHGADEIFGSYEEIKINAVFERLGNLPGKHAISLLAQAGTAIFPNDTAFSRLRDYAKLFALGQKHRSEAVRTLVSVTSDLELKNMFKDQSDELSSAIANSKLLFSKYFSNPKLSSSNAIMEFELENWLPDDILHRVDRMTMAASIEGRVPYLDHRIVELGMSLPVSMKIDSKGDKQILREALRGIVPESMRTRKKQRFNTPIHEFLAEDIDKIARKLFSEKNQLNEEIFLKKTLLQLLDYKKTASYRLLLRHNKLSAQYYARQLWSIIVFYLWYKMYFEDILPENLLEQ